MKLLVKDFSLDEIINYVYSSKELKDKFDKYVLDCNDDFIAELVDYIRGSANYSIGFYNRNYIDVKNHADFLLRMEKLANNFVISDKCYKLIDHAENLGSDNNLFNFIVDKLADAFLNYLNDFCEYVENISFDIFKGEITNEIRDYMDRYVLNDYLSNVYVNCENELVEIKKL